MPPRPIFASHSIPVAGNLRAGWRRRHGIVLLALCLAPTVGGCAIFAPIPTDRGSRIEAVDYNKLVPGVTTRTEASNLLGSPTAHATFDDNTWIYIGEVTAPVPLAHPTVQHQSVVVLNFDRGGVLRQRRILDKSDAHDVAMAGGSTPSPGSETSIMQMLLGNVGRYSPLGGMGGGLGNNGLGNTDNGYGHGGTGNTLGGS